MPRPALLSHHASKATQQEAFRDCHISVIIENAASLLDAVVCVTHAHTLADKHWRYYSLSHSENQGEHLDTQKVVCCVKAQCTKESTQVGRLDPDSAQHGVWNAGAQELPVPRRQPRTRFYTSHPHATIDAVCPTRTTEAHTTGETRGRKNTCSVVRPATGHRLFWVCSAPWP